MSVTLTVNDNLLALTGELTRATVHKLPMNMIDPSLANRAIVIDLKAVNSIDTAGLAWLFLAIEQAQLISSELHFSDVSEDALKLAKLSGVEQLLPLQHNVF